MGIYASPTGASIPSITCLKWKIIASMSLIASDFGGSDTRESSTLIGPSGRRSSACSRIRTDWRISSNRHKYRSYTSPFSPMGTSKS